MLFLLYNVFVYIHSKYGVHLSNYNKNYIMDINVNGSSLIFSHDTSLMYIQWSLFFSPGGNGALYLIVT